MQPYGNKNSQQSYLLYIFNLSYPNTVVVNNAS